MKTDVCQKWDAYMTDACHRKLIMSWQILLNNGDSIFGDYDRPGYAPCWERVKKFFLENPDIKATSISVYMFGAPRHIFFDDEIFGVDGFSISRGVAKEQFMDGDSVDYQFLVVSQMDSLGKKIDVKKFVWPYNEFEQGQAVRFPTKDNVSEMIFQHDSEKFKKVQEYINGAGV